MFIVCRILTPHHLHCDFWRHLSIFAILHDPWSQTIIFFFVGGQPQMLPPSMFILLRWGVHNLLLGLDGGSSGVCKHGCLKKGSLGPRLSWDLPHRRIVIIKPFCEVAGSCVTPPRRLSGWPPPHSGTCHWRCEACSTAECALGGGECARGQGRAPVPGRLQHGPAAAPRREDADVLRHRCGRAVFATKPPPLASLGPNQMTCQVGKPTGYRAFPSKTLLTLTY